MTFQRNSLNPLIHGTIRDTHEGHSQISLHIRMPPVALAFFIVHGLGFLPVCGLFYLFYRLGSFPYTPLLPALFWLGLHGIFLLIFHTDARFSAAEIKKLLRGFS